MGSAEMEMWFEGLDLPDRNSWLALVRGEDVTFDPAATLPPERMSPAPAWWVSVETDTPVDVGFIVEGTAVSLSEDFRTFLESKLT